MLRTACTEKSGLEIRHFSCLKDSNRWQMERDYKTSYQQGKPTPQWGGTGQTPQAMQGMWDTFPVNDFMLSVIFIPTMCLHQNWPSVRYFRYPGEGRSFVSYGSVVTNQSRAWGAPAHLCSPAGQSPPVPLQSCSLQLCWGRFRICSSFCVLSDAVLLTVPINQACQISRFSADLSLSTKKSTQQPNFSCQWVLLLLSLC